MCEYRTIGEKQHGGTRCPHRLSDYLRGSDQKTREDIAEDVFNLSRRNGSSKYTETIAVRQKGLSVICSFETEA